MKKYFEGIALIIAAFAAVAAAWQSYLSHQARDDVIEAIRFEYRLEACADLASFARQFGRELDAYYVGAQNPTFIGTAAQDEQTLRIYEARLAFDVALERVAITADPELLQDAEGLIDGFRGIDFSTNPTNLSRMDAYTTSLGNLLLEFRETCRRLVLQE